ncbi:MAG: sigma-70 family RNA polymerase sigma factor [Prevotellaceae bacterium]|nr:sigma-70 family RNA polymerase sigma factor [Prevotellaceae bacterium]
MPAKKHYDIEKLIAVYRPRLKSFIGRRVDGKEDAEDILQDVFYRLIKTLNAALNPVEQVSAWLYRVARNAIINHYIKKREERLPACRNDEGDNEILQDFSEALSGETAATPEMEYLRALVWSELEAALAELPPEQREIYELTEFDGIPVKEIAQTTGVPVNTLLSRKHYAALHLRKRMRYLYEDIVCS